MKNTMKQLVIGLLALSAIAAEARTGFLISMNVERGTATGTGADLRLADNHLFRIRPRVFSPNFAFTATFSSLGNPNLINRLDLRLRGHTAFGSPRLMLFDFVAERYVDVQGINLPGPGLTSSVTRLYHRVSRFVSSGGLLRVRIEGTSHLILDQILVQSIRL